jgi:transposase-like protein
MLVEALNEEVDAYLGRGRYERTDAYRGYRNGSSSRKLTLGAGTIDVAAPRVRDVPEDQEPFTSKILRKHQRRSDTIDATFLNLLVEGLPRGILSRRCGCWWGKTLRCRRARSAG